MIMTSKSAVAFRKIAYKFPVKDSRRKNVTNYNSFQFGAIVISLTMDI
jgi:hypothetical protein